MSTCVNLNNLLISIVVMCISKFNYDSGRRLVPDTRHTKALIHFNSLYDTTCLFRNLGNGFKVSRNFHRKFSHTHFCLFRTYLLYCIYFNDFYLLSKHKYSIINICIIEQEN